MLETSRLCWVVPALVAAGCASPGPQVVQAPAAPSQPVVIAPVRDDSSMAEEAKALLAQAETDVQRARARRALWLKAWEDLLAARQAVAAKENAVAIRYAKRASELAQLGLEQLAYPAVK
jgi:hypothetical protein